jgi:hypothetical protein
MRWVLTYLVGVMVMMLQPRVGLKDTYVVCKYVKKTITYY